MGPRHTSHVVVKVRGWKLPEVLPALGSRVAERGRRRGRGAEGEAEKGEEERGLPGGVRWRCWWGAELEELDPGGVGVGVGDDEGDGDGDGDGDSGAGAGAGVGATYASGSSGCVQAYP